MAIIEQWHIRSRSHQCAGSGRAFADGEEIVAAIFPDPESSGYLRRDYSVEAWNARPDAEPPFSTWRTTYRQRQHEEKAEAVKKESAEELLRRLAEEDREETESVRYILAVMLERKKLLRETDTQRTPNGILRIYEHRRDGDIFVVRDPDISLDEIATMQEEVIALLEQGAHSNPPATATPDSQAPGA